MKMKQLVVNGQAYQVCDPEAARIDDSRAGSDTCWSGGQIARRLCPEFALAGGAVACTPAEGTVLEVVSSIVPVQSGAGDPAPDGWVELPGTTVYFDGSVTRFISQGEPLVSGGKYRLTVNAKDTAGEKLKLASAEVYDFYGMYGTSLHSGVGEDYVEFTMQCYEGDSSVVEVRLTYAGEADESSIYRENETSGDLELLGGVFTFQRWDTGNVRPISGHTVCTLRRDTDTVEETFTAQLCQVEAAGKNLLPYPYDSGSLTQNGITGQMQSDGGVTFSGTPTGECYYHFTRGLSLTAGTYTFSLSGNWSGRWAFVLLSGTGFTTTLSGSANTVTFTLEEPCTDLQICMYMVDASYVTGTVYPQLETGSTATAYEAYKGSATGQVYGGSYNWSTGELVIDRVLHTLDGSEVWSVAETGTSYAGKDSRKRYALGVSDNSFLKNARFVSDSQTVDEKLLCSKLPGKTASETWYNTDGISSLYSTNTNCLYAYCEAYATDFAGFREMMKGAQLVFGLAEPVTVQLPPRELLALSGVNTLMSDTGATEVRGREDLLAVVESLRNRLAALEAAAAEVANDAEAGT